MTNEEYMALIDQEPTEVKKSEEEGYEYQPASHLKSEMDKVFSGDWDFDMDREGFGKGSHWGKGHIVFTHPVTGRLVTRSGTAAVPIQRGLRMDFPKLETAVMVSAIKKIGKRFGRDLNKKVEDELSTIETEAVDGEFTDEGLKLYQEEKQVLRDFEFREDAEAFRLTATYGRRPEMKSIVNSKKSRDGEAKS